MLVCYEICFNFLFLGYDLDKIYFDVLNRSFIFLLSLVGVLLNLGLLYSFQIQLIRIQMRVPEFGWTTQKVFHLMNFVVNGGKLRNCLSL